MTAVLSGVKVVDLSRVLAGPYAAQILGDLGADVIKIERPGAGDDTRQWGPPFLGDTAVYYHTANRNKRARALDFSRDADRAALLALIDTADVVIENFRPGTLARYGLDYDSVAARNRRLVYCSITGFGADGPHANRAGYDALIQAMGGLMSITGPDADTPTKVGVAVADLSAGLNATIAILAALRERDRSGLGQRCEVSLFGVQVSLLANVAMSYLATGQVPAPLGNAHATVVPYQTFATADRPLMVAIGNDPQFAAFATALGQTWHTEARFATNPARVENREVLVAAIALVLAGRGRDEWLELLSATIAPCGPVNDLGELARDPQTIAEDMFTTMDDGTTPCVRSPLRFSRTPITSYRTPPELDSDPDATFGRDETEP